MTEYITKDAVREMLGNRYGGFLLMLDAMPAVDAVQVVRCKDCRHFKLNLENDPYCSHRNGLSDLKPDDFCSYGVPRENDKSSVLWEESH